MKTREIETASWTKTTQPSLTDSVPDQLLSQTEKRL